MNVPTRPGLDLDQVFDAYFAEIHRYIARRLSRDDADDLAGEVFLVAAGGGYEPSRGDVKPWLYGIATKLIARHHRSEIRRWRALSRTAEREAQSHEDTTLARVAAGRLTGRLAGALAGLNRGDRDVVLLVALAGFTHQEVATALEIPYGTVASRLSRARKHLRLALGDVNPLKEGHDG
ncbi:ECF RNA polymerase sigma factor SigR [Nonomuraea coxensis DSM 45129]|uniref:ECF RNA polymerase sigma factor SigR n=1 Tax=Nonomuraea coxensis DSM 45129 TaxID=1122611 RepID=A0ABX8TWS4_9ACTN|nr:RNA polymerase sigma factor [Nonomuraea coxensis]QYC38969.1 ECF RNA polymerase sigma factor SigR [Nonomuraea coxensis DSM 45129]